MQKYFYDSPYCTTMHIFAHAMQIKYFNTSYVTATERIEIPVEQLMQKTRKSLQPKQ